MAGIVFTLRDDFKPGIPVRISKKVRILGGLTAIVARSRYSHVAMDGCVPLYVPLNRRERAARVNRPTSWRVAADMLRRIR